MNEKKPDIKNDPEYRERVKQRALNRYYQMKQTKANSSIPVN